ncbi:MAG: type IV secretion system DNA-binding domain-containing protein [Symploca sp. SIO3C6]|nr:type IV secretion system DNA-binding domain-containing protein [Symploca sp. SIO3C6]
MSNLDLYRQPDDSNPQSLDFVHGLFSQPVAPKLDELTNSPHELTTDDEVPLILVPPAKNERDYLFIGGYYMPLSKAEGHTLLVGASGSGKSKLTYPAIAHACSTLSPGNGLVVIFDVKGDMYPLADYFAKKQEVPLHYFNATDARSNVWDIAKDADGYIDVLNELIHILIPAGDARDPFWIQGAQAVGMAVALSLIKTKRTDWGLHDLYNACFSDLEKLVEFLRHNSTNEPVIERILESDAEKTTAGILMQLSVALQSMRLAAAQQYHTPKEQWVSLKEVVDKGGIMVIGQKPTSRASTTPLMRAMFKRLSDIILDLPEYTHPPTYIYIDEFAYLGKQLPGVMDLLTFSRSKRCQVYLTVQNIDQLRENYGTHGAESIVSNCEFQVILRAGSVETAHWASRLCGQERTLQPSFSRNAGGFAQNWSFVTRERLLADEFRMLPRASRLNGLHFVFISPYSGVVRTHLPPDMVDELTPPKSNTPARIDIAAHRFDLPRWNPNLSVEKKVSPMGREEYVRQGESELERAIRHHVWQLFEDMSETAMYDFLS